MTIWVPANGGMVGAVRASAGGEVLAQERVEFLSSRSPFWPLVGVLADSPGMARALSQVSLPYQGLEVPIDVVQLQAEEMRPTRAALLGPDGARREVDLVPAGPGRYRGALGPVEPGAYIVQAIQSSGGSAELRAAAGWAAPYPAEYREIGADHALLARIADAGAGRVLTSAEEALAPDARRAVATWPMAPLLLVLAAVLWPLEIAARRLSLPARPAWVSQLKERLQPLCAALERREEAQAEAAAPLVNTADRLLQRKRSIRKGR